MLPLPEGASAAEDDAFIPPPRYEEEATTKPEEEEAVVTRKAADPVQKAPQRFAARDNVEGLPTVRGTFAFGGQIAAPTRQLNSAMGPIGAGGQLSLGFAPPTWPVIFGLSLDLISFGSSNFDYEESGLQFTARIEKLSHRGQLFVRVQPERGALRPYLDLLGGYWLLAFNHHQIHSDEDNPNTVRASVTGAWGLRAGVDWLFGAGPNVGNYGVGFDVHYSRGVSFSFPDFSTAEGENSEVTIPGSFTLKAPSELLFTFSFVVSSNRGNWVTSKPKVDVR
jgi:hypothetical protein